MIWNCGVLSEDLRKALGMNGLWGPPFPHPPVSPPSQWPLAGPFFCSRDSRSGRRPWTPRPPLATPRALPDQHLSHLSEGPGVPAGSLGGTRPALAVDLVGPCGQGGSPEGTQAQAQEQMTCRTPAGNPGAYLGYKDPETPALPVQIPGTLSAIRVINAHHENRNVCLYVQR